MKTLATAVALVPLLMVGCTTTTAFTTTLTPQQKKVYADFDACQQTVRAATMELGRVNPDGSFTLEGMPNQRYAVVYCMRAKGHRID
jgi:hypothetical protein